MGGGGGSFSNGYGVCKYDVTYSGEASKAGDVESFFYETCHFLGGSLPG